AERRYGLALDVDDVRRRDRPSVDRARRGELLLDERRLRAEQRLDVEVAFEGLELSLVGRDARGDVPSRAPLRGGVDDVLQVRRDHDRGDEGGPRGGHAEE